MRTVTFVLRNLVFVLLLVSLLACGQADRPRVLVLGLDGMDPGTIDLLMAEGKMPNFARLRQEGAYGRLRSQKPLLSPILWTTIATGRSPADHGIGHFVAVDATTGEERPVTSRMRRVKALWNMTAESEKTSAVVGWWATWPAEDVGNGQIVSDHAAYHFLFEDGFTGGKAEGKTHPPELAARIDPMLRRPKDVTDDELKRFVHLSEADANAPPEDATDAPFANDLEHFKWALATAKSYRDIGLDLWQNDQPDLGLVYIEGTDSTSHLFGHLFRVEGLAGDLAEQQKRFGQTVEEMYLFADELVGDFLEVIDDETTLILVSDHGFELGALHDDPSRTQDMRRVSERFHREDGIFYAYGRGVRPNARVEGAHILDITPTVLTLLDLPIAQDMPGKVLKQALLDGIEPLRIASWEDGSVPHRNGSDERDVATEQAVVERLRNLGYLGGGSEDSPKGDRNLAAIAFSEGRYREAAKAYKALIDEHPEDAGLLTSFAGVLGALERYDEALVQIEKALELDPLNVEAYHNRGVIHERSGQRDLAIADYKNAVRYRPDYEPSRQALVRLTGTASTQQPTSEAEAKASALAELASQAARRGDYPRALNLLDQAEQAAPKYVLVYQYRSNVAFLMGDRNAAIQALEKGLEIEPDNQLFKTNLERLKQN